MQSDNQNLGHFSLSPTVGIRSQIFPELRALPQQVLLNAVPSKPTLPSRLFPTSQPTAEKRPPPQQKEMIHIQLTHSSN